MFLDLQSVRMALCIVHLVLAALGSVNLVVIFVILVKPSMRTVTNVYMVGLCFADFTYVANLSMVAIAQLSKTWSFGHFLCTIYWITETTSKYATVLFVVLMAFDRYCALCQSSWRRYRSFYSAILQSLMAWGIAAAVASPIFLNSTVKTNFIGVSNETNETITRDECKADWQQRNIAKWYIFSTALAIFFLPLIFIVFFYYHILMKMRQALQTNRRMSRSASSRAPYQRVTYFVLTVIFSHIVAWTPFWIYTLYASLVRIERGTVVRLLLNVMHLLPYINCAANPFIYLANFRKAFQSTLQVMFFCKSCRLSNMPQTACKSNRLEPTIARTRYETELSDNNYFLDTGGNFSNNTNNKRFNKMNDKTASTFLTNDTGADTLSTDDRHYTTADGYLAVNTSTKQSKG